jgi:hypothetical protein
MLESLALDALGTIAETLATFIGVVGLLAGVFFVYVFTKKLGIFEGNRIREWREEFVASRPVRAVRSIRELPLRWRSKSAVPSKSFRHEALDQRPRFVALNAKIPITSTVYRNVRAMGGHPEPFSAILKTTNPPTLKKTSDGMFPIVTELQVVESFDALSSFNQEQKPCVVGTLHNHRNDYALAESCERKLATMDLVFGRQLIHIVVCPKGMQLYRSVQSSADTKAEQCK